VNHVCNRAGLRLAEVPIVFPERARGKSKMSLGIVIEAAVVVLRLRVSRNEAVVRGLERQAPVSTAG
jgi:dolichol-phosphate mannosyltransferase